MKKQLAASALAAACAMPALVHAQAAAAPAKPEPDFTFTGNLTIASDYRFRGFTQTDYQPAIQGGVDFAHKSGFYLGNWNSNVSSGIYNGAPIEMDFYGGWKTTFDSFGFDVGVIYYYYPGTGEYNPDFKAKNFEAYVGGSWGPLAVKYFYSFTDFFGVNAPGVDTKGSQYLDLNFNYPIGEFAVVAHAGWQVVKNYQNINTALNKDNVWDYKVGGTWDIGGSGWVVGAFLVGTTEKDFFVTAQNPPQGAGKNSFLATLTKTF
jgi:uncharacterized protein (TIGR02001 family)